MLVSLIDNQGEEYVKPSCTDHGRLDLMAMIRLSGILLFSTLFFNTNPLLRQHLQWFIVNTKVATVYDPFLTLHATAGAGSFNGSFVRSMLGRVNGTITSQALAYAYTFCDK